jgi:hypothetical protein
MRHSRRVKPGVWAALFIALAVGVYLWPALVGGHVLSPGVSLFHYVPWKATAPPGWHQYDNISLNDATTEYYPWWVFARHALASGNFPMWNPHELSGSPAFSNANTLILSPFALPSLLLPLKYSFGVAAAIKLWVAGFGMYLLARRLTLGFWAGIVGGLAYAFSSHTLLWSVDPILNVVVLLPMCLWLTERLLQRGRLSDASWLAVAVGAALLGGHPASDVYLVSAIAVYGVARLAFWPAEPEVARIRRGLLVLGGIALGVAIAAVALLPLAMLIPGSTSQGARSGGLATIPLTALRTWLVPNWWGRPGDHAAAAGPLPYHGRTVYAGAVVLGLAVVGALNRADWRPRLPVLLVGLLAAAHAYGIPPVHSLLRRLPVFDDIVTTEIAFVIVFAIALLGSYGMQDVLAGTRPAVTRLRVAIGLLAAAGLVGLIAAQPSGSALEAVARHFTRGPDVTTPTELALTSVVWLLLLTGGLALAVWAGRRARSAVLLAVGVTAVVAIDAEHFVHGFQPMAPAKLIYGRPPPAIRFLQRHAGSDRVAGVGTALPPDTAGVYGLRDVRGYDPPEPDRRYMRFFAMANPAQPTAGFFSIREQLGIPAFTPSARRVLQVLGARHIVQDPAEQPLRGAGLVPVYRGADATIYRDSGASRRAYLPRTVTTRPTDDQAFRELTQARGAPANDVVVTAPYNAAPRAASGSVRIVEDRPGTVRLRASLRQAGLVVLNERWHPGWQVRVDGRAHHIHRVNYVLQGVNLAAGNHTITWSYRAPGLRAGLVITALAVLAATAGIATPLVARRRRRSRHAAHTSSG